MSTSSVNLSIVRGSTFHRNISWIDGDGNAVDITGYTARMHIRPSWQSTQHWLKLSSRQDEGGGITVDAFSQRFQLLIDAQTTATLLVGTGVYDFLATNSAGVVTRLMFGAITVVPQTTRSS